MDNETKLKIEERIVEMLKTVYDPEIPVNVYDLGLIYKIDLQDDGEAVIDMTLTAPNCPAADFIMEDIRQKIESVEGVTAADPRRPALRFRRRGRALRRGGRLLPRPDRVRRRTLEPREE